MEEKISSDNVEVCVVRADNKSMENRTKAQILTILDTLG